MQNILSSQQNIDAVHVIGHGSIGQIAFGTAVLNSDTLSAYENILQEIGSSLSENGDILFYGCNVCLLYTSPSPRDLSTSRMPSSA